MFTKEGYLIKKEDWNEVICASIAEALGLLLTPLHLQLIHWARAYYQAHQRLPAMRPLLKLCQQTVDPTLDSLKMNTLFLGHPLSNLAKLAGLPKPLHCM
jgi:tRNA 2-thiouridine synthesizing protein E